MFNFMKKAAEKEEKERRKREKREKKDGKKRDRGSMSAEELLRLDEMRRSLRIRGRRKEKEKLPSGITADYSASFFAQLDRDVLDDAGASLNSSGGPGGLSTAQSDSSEASLNSLSNSTSGGQKPNLPPLPPKPPKRGILKGPRLSVASSSSGGGGGDCPGTLQLQNGVPPPPMTSLGPEANNLLARNTLQNELIAYQNLPLQTSNGSRQHDLLLSLADDGDSYSSGRSPQQMHHHHFAQDTKLLHVMTSASPSADSLTDTTNSSFATPPFSLSPVGESQGWSRWRSTGSFEDQGCIELQLPDIVPLELPEPRELVIQRQPPPRSDFGFSLRRAVVVERTASGATLTRQVVFAEPGVLVQNVNDTGLLPGDRLIEVNGVNVDDKSREEIIDLIKGSDGSVAVKVQPVAELSELSRRNTIDGHKVELAPSNIRGGTLRRSGSLRFHHNRLLRRKGKELTIGYSNLTIDGVVNYLDKNDNLRRRNAASSPLSSQSRS
ncbi:hypothetical protein QAD02_014545 [Eretmocerus hayati]|uniref:Uncharacterized protein n=1 Tax=Eretmocerus hayati TaxID=131215 RepID=A0ACC2P5M4_9HYME|nr:hypothetical protein QAD02_014545 [Eretmocerus hayati]